MTRLDSSRIASGEDCSCGLEAGVRPTLCRPTSAAAHTLTTADRSAYRRGMDRRRFLLTSLAAAFAAPLPAGAQQAGPHRRIGVLLVGLSRDSMEAQSFRQGLRDAGYAEGKNVV